MSPPVKPVPTGLALELRLIEILQASDSPVSRNKLWPAISYRLLSAYLSQGACIHVSVPKQ